MNPEEHRTSNIEHRTPNIEHRTPNIERRTSNAEHRMAARIFAYFGVRCSMLNFRCFPSVQVVQRAKFSFGEISP